MEANAALAGRRIGITADRRWAEQAELFRRRGAEVVHGPTLATVDLSASEQLRAATSELVLDPPDVLVVTTGMGFRMWLEAADGWGEGERLREALGGARVVARGAKASSAAKGAGLRVWWQSPDETMAGLVDRLAAEDPAPSRVALQLFDPRGHPSTSALAELAAELVEVPVYQWSLPADPEPALRLVADAADGRLDAVTFTSQPAVYQLFGLAAGADRADDLRRAFNDGTVVPACIGHVCAAAAREEGIERPMWPEPPRLVAMVRQVTDRLAEKTEKLI